MSHSVSLVQAQEEEFLELRKSRGNSESELVSIRVS